MFLWHTATDETVPVEHSFLFAKACKEKEVAFELHIFGNGPHGLSLANEAWASGNFGGFYTWQQMLETLRQALDNHMELPPVFNMLREIPQGASVKDALLEVMKQFAPPPKHDEGIAIWPLLAHNWLKKVLSF